METSGSKVNLLRDLTVIPSAKTRTASTTMRTKPIHQAPYWLWLSRCCSVDDWPASALLEIEMLRCTTLMQPATNAGAAAASSELSASSGSEIWYM
jgi:hypothetical protein